MTVAVAVGVGVGVPPPQMDFSAVFVSAPPSNPPTTNAVLAPIAVPAVKERAWFKDGVVAQVSLVGS